MAKKYKCPYCLAVLDELPEDAAKETEEKKETKEVKETKAESQENEEAVLYTCPSCGAEIITDATTAATFCYYCHNPVVLSGRLEGKYLPDMVVPFQLDKKKATESFLSFVKKKKFVPTAFFNKNQIEKLTGVYYPYWTCTAKGRASAHGEGRNIKVWRSGDTEYTETDVYAVDREGSIAVQNVMRGALKKADHRIRAFPFRPDIFPDSRQKSGMWRKPISGKRCRKTSRNMEKRLCWKA